jgi:hypothetical protein
MDASVGAVAVTRAVILAVLAEAGKPRAVELGRWLKAQASEKWAGFVCATC